MRINAISAILLLFITSLVVGLGCRGGNSRMRTETPTSKPLELTSAAEAWKAAGVRRLPATEPTDDTGLHNVYHLGDRIVSGSEPQGAAAFAALAAMGVRTILSVDGKSPDVEAAERHGLRYVHVPIRYRGITDKEFARLAKTFREAEAPFYVHCFHGRHRGPAAAAVGRVVLDGVDRHLALAEMRQWCGAAEKYAGLYHDVATRAIPSTEETASDEWNLPARISLGGYRQAMIGIVRASDALKMLRARKWEADPAHPDVDAVNEADKLADLFERSRDLDSVRSGPAALARWNDEAAMASRRLHGLLLEHRQGRGDAALMEAAFHVIHGGCKSCHAQYRNHR